MTTTHSQQEPLPNRKNYAAVIGFVLALAGFVSYGLTAVPALIFSLIGIRRKKHRKLAAAGIVTCLCFLLLQILFITPMGSVGYPLNVLKYRIVCKSHFWLGFDKDHLVEAQSGRTFLLWGSTGSIYFKAGQKDFYDANQIIGYAQKHGWVYRGRIHLAGEDFSNFLCDSGGLDEGGLEMWRTMHELTVYLRSPLWIKDDCTVFGFETGQLDGIPSYVMVHENRSEMAVYANHQCFPVDPTRPFKLPPLFEKAE